jgi:hypothetical protein
MSREILVNEQTSTGGLNQKSLHSESAETKAVNDEIIYVNGGTLVNNSMQHS